MNTALFSGLGRFRDFGLLVLRLGVGTAFVLYGYPKITGGTEMWTQLGQSMGIFKINFAPTVWGFAAAFAEFGGGILMILGLFFRPAMLLMLSTMIVAATTHLANGDGLMKALHPIELACVFLALLLVGPGRFSVDGK